jgi:hypothetical protein
MKNTLCCIAFAVLSLACGGPPQLQTDESAEVSAESVQAIDQWAAYCAKFGKTQERCRQLSGRTCYWAPVERKCLPTYESR